MIIWVEGLDRGEADQRLAPMTHAIIVCDNTCPTITILYWDCPESLPSNIAKFLFQLGEDLPNDNLYLFESFLDRFVADFFLPISPYDSP